MLAVRTAIFILGAKVSLSASDVEQYSARDDLESLAYTLLVMRFPESGWEDLEEDWDDVEGECEGVQCVGKPTIFARRDKLVSSLRSETEQILDDFVQYTRSLTSTDTPNYLEWSARFCEAAEQLVEKEGL